MLSEFWRRCIHCFGKPVFETQMNDTGLKFFVRVILISYWLLLFGLVLLFCFFLRVSDGEMGDTFFMTGVFFSFIILLPFANWAR